MKIKKIKKALLDIKAFALCLCFSCGALLGCGNMPCCSSEDGTTDANEPMRESGRGELLDDGIESYFEYNSRIAIAWCYVPPQILTGTYASYRYYGTLSPSEVKKENVGKCLEQAEVYVPEKERHVVWNIFEIRGVDPAVAVCLYFTSERCYSVYLNCDYAPETFANFSDAWNIKEYLTLRSRISCYEYCTEDSTYLRRYEASAEAAATLQEILFSIDGQGTSDWKEVYADYKKAADFSYGYLDGLDFVSICILDNGYLTIDFSECEEVFCFEIGKENAEQLIRYIESFPRAEVKKRDVFDDSTIMETTTTNLKK